MVGDKWSRNTDFFSDATEKIRYVCVGDPNFTVAQEKRSGGTVAFPCKDLWESINQILSTKSIGKDKNKSKNNKHKK